MAALAITRPHEFDGSKRSHTDKKARRREIDVPFIQLDCPHCQTDTVGFAPVSEPVPVAGMPYGLLMLQCGACGDAVVLKSSQPALRSWLNGAMPQVPVLACYPHRERMAAPLHVPENVASFFLQGVDNVRRRNFDAAGTMFRKVLDATTRAINPHGKGNLEGRIDSIPAEHGLTPAMKEWAHEIRHLGNDAAHEEDPFTAEEARSLQSFTELFLTYAFTLPEMTKARKAERLSKPA